MRRDDQDSAFDARMKEIDDARPAPGLAAVIFGWGSLLALLVAGGALLFAFGPHIAEFTSGDHYQTEQVSDRARPIPLEQLLHDTKEEAWWRAKLGALAGLLLFVAIVAKWGREDIEGILKKKER